MLTVGVEVFSRKDVDLERLDVFGYFSVESRTDVYDLAATV